MGKRHGNAKLDDATWRGLFGRWHAGEASRALRVEAGVTGDTWSENARRLGMRIEDLPEGHPAKRRSPPFEQRADDWKHWNSLLTEGEWRALFALRAQGVPDTALCARYGVAAATICSQAKARGITRAQVRAVVAGMEGEMGAFGIAAAVPGPPHPSALPTPSPEGEGEAAVRPLAGVEIVMGDPGRTMASFDGVIAEAGRRADYVTITTACRAKLSVKRAMFGESAVASPSPPHPVGDADHPPLHGEGEGEALELREAQRPPEGDWSTWLFLGGRGAGKTLAGAMWLSDMAEALGPPVPGGGGRLALIGPSLHDVREVMIEGVSGIVGLPRWAHPKWGGRRPVFEPSRRRLTFPNGAMAYAFSAEDPDSLRGPQFGAAWADEFCAWPRTRGGPGETLALLRMGLRLPGPVGASEAQAGSDRVATGSPPRLLVTTTPKPIAALRALRAEAGCVQTHAATRDNAAHLSAGFVEGLERLYGGTRKAEQELEGRVVEADGALFTSEMLARARGAATEARQSPSHPGGGSAARSGGGVGAARRDIDGVTDRPALPTRSLRDHPPPEGEGERPCSLVYDRVVVAIDPTTTAAGNACGIVVAGRCGERVHVLADRSVAGLGPDGWARRAVRAAEEFGAAALVAEVNQGGEMVQAVLKTAGCAVRVRSVRATKGKRVRAEPVAALYEQGRVTHAPGLGALEEELMAFGGEDEGQYDLDRADALVWAVTDLLIDRAGGGAGPRVSLLDWGVPPSGLVGRGW